MPATELSRSLALAWGLAAAPQRGPKRELSLERIVEAAIGIANAEGLPAVTMQRVAQTFDFSTMALYRYVATKDELHRLMLDAALSGTDAPVDWTDWRAGVRGFVLELLEVYRAHPWSLDIHLSPEIHFMPGQLRMADRGLRAMRELPVSEETKLGVIMVFSAFARGHAAVEREVMNGGVAGPETRALLLEAVTPARFPDAAQFVRSGAYFGDPPAVVAGSEAAADTEAEVGAGPRPETATDVADGVTEIREFAVELLLAGLESILDPAAAAGAGAPPAQLTPQEALAVAEHELRAATELRKEAQRRVREAEKREAAVRQDRDRAKEAAKAHLKQQRALAKE